MVVLRPILLLVAVFLFGYFACSYLPSPSQLFTYSSRSSPAGYTGYGGYRGYGGNGGYGRYGDAGEYGGYGRDGGGTPDRTWDEPTYAISAPYPRRIMRPLPPPPCYSPCDY
jgi:hypothetical protein